MIRAEVLTVNPSQPTVGALRRLARPVAGSLNLPNYEYSSIRRAHSPVWTLSRLLFSGRCAAIQSAAAVLALRLAVGVVAVMLAFALRGVDALAAWCVFAGGLSMALGLGVRLGSLSALSGIAFAAAAGVELPLELTAIVAAGSAIMALLGGGWFGFDFHIGRTWRCSIRRAAENRRLSYKSFRA